jgi:predicted transcriptional regulator
MATKRTAKKSARKKSERSTKPAWFKPYISTMDAAHADIEALTKRHEALTKSVMRLSDDLKHLTEALHQRGVWNHDYSEENRP